MVASRSLFRGIGLVAALAALSADALVAHRAAACADELAVAARERVVNDARSASFNALLYYQEAHRNPRGDYPLPSAFHPDLD